MIVNWRNFMRKTFLGFLVVFQLFFVNASAQTVSKEVLAKKVIKITGIERMIEAIPAQVANQLFQEKMFSEKPEVIEKASVIADKLFDLKIAKDQFLRHFIENATTEELGDILNWLETPLGKRISKAEIDAETLEGQKKMQKYLENLDSPSNDRIQLMLKFEKEAKITDKLLRFLKLMMVGMVEVGSEVFPNKEEKTPEQIQEELEQVWKGMEPVMRKLYWKIMVLNSHYIYKDFSNAEIESYIIFLKSETGEKFNTLGMDGTFKIFDSFMKSFFKEVFQLLQAHKNEEEGVKATP